MILAAKWSGLKLLLAGLFLSFTMVAFFASSQHSHDVEIFTGKTMGTTYHIQAVMPRGVSERDRKARHADLQQRIQSLLDDINGKMSTYQPTSELSRFNRSTTQKWFAVSQETAETARIALEIARLTDGAFDVTIAPLVNFWGFGPHADFDQKARPDPSALAAIKKRVGFQKFLVHPDKPLLKKKHPHLTLDFSGVAKGYGVDGVARYLEKEVSQNYMIEIGGEIKTKGLNHRGQKWNVAIEVPNIHQRLIQRVIRLQDGAVATSGDYRNFIVRDGKRLSHIIDPTSGWPISHDTASVTIVDASCARADALATAFLVLGAEKGFELAAKHGIAAHFIILKESGFEERSTKEFEQFI
jgi:thiamine biosynthesis lipoprotein